jgi:Mg2+ and Co2+ transporter CorA
MELLLLNGAAVVGQSLLGNVIKEAYDAIKKGHKHSYISSVLKEIDIQSDIEIIEAYLDDIKELCVSQSSSEEELNKYEGLKITTNSSGTIASSSGTIESSTVSTVSNLSTLSSVYLPNKLYEDKNNKKCYKSIIECKKKIHSLIEQIKDEIENINIKIIDNHYSTYYHNYFYRPDYEKNIENLKNLKVVLNNRFNMLIRLSNQ